jgi:hypothetical protein
MDTARKQVCLEDGRNYGYDKLLLHWRGPVKLTSPVTARATSAL